MFGKLFGGGHEERFFAEITAGDTLEEIIRVASEEAKLLKCTLHNDLFEQLSAPDARDRLYAEWAQGNDKIRSFRVINKDGQDTEVVFNAKTRKWEIIGEPFNKKDPGFKQVLSFDFLQDALDNNFYNLEEKEAFEKAKREATVIGYELVVGRDPVMGEVYLLSRLGHGATEHNNYYEGLRYYRVDRQWEVTNAVGGWKTFDNLPDALAASTTKPAN
ncbi:MAG TPA: hypothetical protein DEB09_00695 [Candidatus Magasanikbacteria bacterium]|nr:hypothetical protein [Candidatus Magasanikbacteria bacterium]